MQNEIIVGTDVYKKGDGLTLEANTYANQGNAVLGIREAGKTYTAMKLAEGLLDAEIPILVFDPIGVWKNLRVGINGNAGYPVVIAGGPEDDIPLTEANAVAILRGAMETNASIIFNFFTPKLQNKATWIRIVEGCLEYLMYNNLSYGLRHIFIEEAAEFIPQVLRPQHYKVFDAFERVARMGRNVGLGFTVINQRAEQINKSIYELCALVFLHKQTGKNSLTAIGNWMKVMQLPKEITAGIMENMPRLNSGQCFVIGDGKSLYLQVGVKKTFHPNPKTPTPENVAMPSVHERVTKILIAGKLNPIEIALEASQPVPKKEKAATDKSLAIVPNQADKEEKEKLQRENRMLRELLENMKKEHQKTIHAAVKSITELMLVMNTDEKELMSRTVGNSDGPPRQQPPATLRYTADAAHDAAVVFDRNMGKDLKLGKCANAMLGVLNKYRSYWFSKKQLALLTCYSPGSGNFGNAISELRSAKLIIQDKDTFNANTGNPAFEVYAQRVKKDVKYSVYIRKNKLGKAEREIFDVFMEYPKRTFTLEELAQHTQTRYSHNTGHFNNAISTLSSLGIALRGSGKVSLDGEVVELLSWIDNVHG